MIWVDTDFGFDDLWAILLLRRYGIEFAGVSLVAGNAPLAQVKANAMGANQAYALDLPLYEGAAHPLVRDPETAQSILGPSGMQTLGRTLPSIPTGAPLPAALPALADWLMAASEEEARDILAIGPLTNIAHLIRSHPEAARKITRLVWMGGGNGQGNHTPFAEFNAIADPEAADIVMRAAPPMEIADLTLCRTVTFTESEIPSCDPLTSDLLGGYFGIAKMRGKDTMSIYDPVAALAIIEPSQFRSEAMAMTTVIDKSDRYGETVFTPDANATGRLLINAPSDAAQRCLEAIEAK